MGTIALIRWLIACFAVSMLMKPVFDFRGLRLTDEGFSMSLGIGTAVSFFPVFWLCVITGCPFNTVTCRMGLILTSLCFGIIKFRKGSRKKVRMTVPERTAAERRRRFLTGFFVFAVLLTAAAYIKGFKPMIDSQTEQYMDFGFMKAMYRQQKLPPDDMWCTGERINYYYLGQAIAVWLCRISGVTPGYGYNLMLCTLFASLMMTVYTLVEAFLRAYRGMGRAGAYTGGAAAALMCALGGNGHWIIYGIVQQLYHKVRGTEPSKRYWFPESTVYIGNYPDIPDKGKHEFPSYTLILGDLHAHVCNMLFTIPLLAVLLDYALCETDGSDPYSPYESVNGHTGRGKKRMRDLTVQICSPHMILTGIMLGLFKGVNYWDFPIYYVVAGAVILFTDIKKEGISLSTLAKVLLKGVFILLLSAFIILPFTVNYVKPVSGIHFADGHSPLYKLIIIWFAHVIMASVLIIYIMTGRNGRKAGGTEGVMAALALCGLGLLLMPEIIYVKDIYGDAYQRYNTMFKLTFQGFILLSLSSGMCIGLLLDRGMTLVKNNRKTGSFMLIGSFVFCIWVLLLAGYTFWSVRAWFGNIFRTENRAGISAVSFIDNDRSFENERDAIEILNSDKDRELRIIEEAGNSYSPENRLSVFTGASTVSGWYVHEWVWHNDSEEVRERHKEVNNFYSCGYEDYCRALILKYDIDYIYVGPKVLEKYNVDPAGFSGLGEHVWESADGRYMLIRVFKD